MAQALEKKGHDAFLDEDYDQALEFFSQAVALDPSEPSHLVSRAGVQIKLGHFADAIADTKKAIELDPSLPKAYLRKGIACFSLEEYEDAKAAFEKSAALEDLPMLRSWIQKCNAKLQDESAKNPGSSASLDVVMTPAPEPVVTPPRYRQDWYQSDTAVIVTIYAKNVNPSDAKIEVGEQMLIVVINAPNEEPYVFQTRLFGKVKVSQCNYNFLSTKIEIRLVKADDLHWKGLTYDMAQAPMKVAAVKEMPTSSKKGGKNWDKLEAQVKNEEKDEKLEGDAALNKLFKEIYSKADDDTRRAMNKSFVESSGTVLSTNWKDVGSKKIEGSAPQGMEMKKWEI